MKELRRVAYVIFRDKLSITLPHAARLRRRSHECMPCSATPAIRDALPHALDEPVILGMECPLDPASLPRFGLRLRDRHRFPFSGAHVFFLAELLLICWHTQHFRRGGGETEAAEGAFARFLRGFGKERGGDAFGGFDAGGGGRGGRDVDWVDEAVAREVSGGAEVGGGVGGTGRLRGLRGLPSLRGLRRRGIPASAVLLHVPLLVRGSTDLCRRQKHVAGIRGAEWYLRRSVQ